jgi:signal peptidase II
MNKVTSWFSKVWLVLAVAATSIILDQWTKSLVRASIPKYASVHPVPALGDYLIFEHVDNYGAAFGILQGQGSLFIVTDQWIVRVLLGLQLGGAVGNVLDRLHQGYVTDFIKTGIPGFYYIPNYNIADMSIFFGVVGLAIVVIFDDMRKQREEKAAAGRSSEADTTITEQ